MAGNQRDRLTRLELPARLADQPPTAFFIDAEEQALPFAAGLRSFADEPGGDDFCFVEDQQIVRPEQVRELAKAAVRDVSRLTIENEQPRRVTLRQRLRGDEFGGEIVVVQGRGIGHRLIVAIGIRVTVPAKERDAGLVDGRSRPPRLQQAGRIDEALAVGKGEDV